MMRDMTDNGMMWGMGIFGLIGLIILVLCSQRSLNSCSSGRGSICCIPLRSAASVTRLWLVTPPMRVKAG